MAPMLTGVSFDEELKSGANPALSRNGNGDRSPKPDRQSLSKYLRLFFSSRKRDLRQNVQIGNLTTLLFEVTAY